MIYNNIGCDPALRRDRSATRFADRAVLAALLGDTGEHTDERTKEPEVDRLRSFIEKLKQPAWYGSDPGGSNKFGVAALSPDGRFETCCVSSVDQAVALISRPISSLGRRLPDVVDVGGGGGRKVDFRPTRDVRRFPLARFNR